MRRQAVVRGDEGRPRGRQHRHRRSARRFAPRWRRRSAVCRTRRRSAAGTHRSGGDRAGADRRRRCAGWWCCRPRPRAGPFSEVGRLLSLPGTLVLLIATALVGAVIFVPARRRLRALERAAERIGAGDLDVARRRRRPRRDRAAWPARSTACRPSSRRAPTRCTTSDRVRRQMLADVSHELRTPLTAMRGYLDTLAHARRLARRRRRGPATSNRPPRSPAARAHRRRPARPGPTRARRLGARHRGCSRSSASSST